MWRVKKKLTKLKAIAVDMTHFSSSRHSTDILLLSFVQTFCHFFLTTCMPEVGFDLLTC